MVRCALVCITKNEKRYMSEFVSYYHKLGFSTVFLYDNSNNYELRSFHQPPSVQVIRFPGSGRQLLAYHHFLLHYKRHYDYVAFFDSDEFLVLKKHTDIGRFCQEHIPSGALGINWYLFGNNGRSVYEEDLVIRRFTKRSNSMHPLVKTIAKCSDIREMNIHNPYLINGQFLNCRKQIIQGPRNMDFDDSLAQLNHYCTKSDQEYEWKIQRGRGSVAQKRNYSDLCEYLHLNHVEDLFALRFYTNETPEIRIALVFFLGSTLSEDKWWKNREWFSQIFIYHPEGLHVPDMGSDSVCRIVSTRDQYQQHFLTYHKNAFSHTLFMNANEKLDFSGNLINFCRTSTRNGVIQIRSKNERGIRILGKCEDLLEMRDFEVLKLGYGESIRETAEIYWSST